MTNLQNTNLGTFFPYDVIILSPSISIFAVIFKEFGKIFTKVRKIFLEEPIIFIFSHRGCRDFSPVSCSTYFQCYQVISYKRTSNKKPFWYEFVVTTMFLINKFLLKGLTSAWSF